MAKPRRTLVTPIYLKSDKSTAWPEGDSAFYLLTADGLFLCRNSLFFRSSVAARGWPTELARHEGFLRIRYPKIPRRLLELCVGFFARIADLHNAEAAVVLAWDTVRRRVRLVVPEQVSIVRKTWYRSTYPVSVRYQMPILPPRLMVMGDVHSHVDESAYASYTDRWDETYRPGLHIVTGRISSEPPDFHIEAVVDGARFKVKPSSVLGGYNRRRMNVPQSWIDLVKVECEDPHRESHYRSEGPVRTCDYGGSGGQGACADGGYGADAYGQGDRDAPRDFGATDSGPVRGLLPGETAPAPDHEYRAGTGGQN